MARIDLADIASWLHLAATPTFAIMAAVTVIHGDPMTGMLCSEAHRMELGSMAPMYLLMSVFHAAPWLRLIAAPQAPRSASSAVD
jgi:hypothetical protein